MGNAQPFTGMMLDSEISVLRRIHGMLEHDPIATRDEFADLMKAAFQRMRFDARKLADDLGYSISAVYRWIDGTSAPHPSVWPTIVRWIMRAIVSRIHESEKCDDFASA
jgi:hypothetical protein